MSATTPTFQTIRLSRGRHASPDEGACVMELASMLGRERFSDHPRSVCPVIGMVLRAYNDGADDERRQDLYRYAAAAVGTRERAARRARLRRCEEFVGVRPARLRALLDPRLHVVGQRMLAYAESADNAAHERFLALVDELIGADALAAPIDRAETEPRRENEHRLDRS